jgi:hypothetical protein
VVGFIARWGCGFTFNPVGKKIIIVWEKDNYRLEKRFYRLGKR